MDDKTALILQELPHLRRYAQHLTHDRDAAQDLVQDCMERAVRKSRLFRDGTNMRAWLFTMMRNIFINGRRRENLGARVHDGLRSKARSFEAPSQFDAVLLRRTQLAIERLGQDEREAVLLMAIDQQTYRETSDSNGTPIGTMKSRLSRARERLREDVLAEERTEPSPEL